MSTHEGQIAELLAQSRQLEHGAAKVALVQEAVRLADTHGDVAAGFEARSELITAAMFAGQPDVELVAFSWCLAQCDRAPEQFSEEDLLWKYKWVLDTLPLFPQISRPQIENMLEDMKTRYQRAGSTLHAVHTLRRDVSMYLGDRAQAEASHIQLERTRRDWLSNCAACVADGTVEYLNFLGRHEEALERARPILAGQQICSEVPHRTYALVLYPLFLQGRLDEAMEYHLKGYKLIARNPKFISQQAEHLNFLTLTDNLPRAIKLLEKHLPSAMITAGLAWQLTFMLAGQLLLERLGEAGRKTVKLLLPDGRPRPDAQGRSSVAELRDWFAAQALDLAQRFDARNGNDFQQQRIKKLEVLKGKVKPYPVPVRGKPSSPEQEA